MQYSITVRNKFDILQETSERHTPNDKYENFTSVHLEAAAKCIPTKEANAQSPCETEAVREKRNNKKKASLYNKTNPTNINMQNLKNAYSTNLQKITSRMHSRSNK